MKTCTLLLTAVITCAIAMTTSAQTTTKSSTAADPDAAYADFGRFCRQYFGAEKEPLVYEKFGKELQVAEDGSWRHVSENSACIAWQTNLPARTRVEYGETDQYGGRTPETERFFYTHVHYVKDLKADATYHCRMVSTDERGNKVTSPDATFQTKKIAGALYIPGDVQGPPYLLKEPNKTYVLKEDITAPGAAIAIFAAGVALDLNGHTVTYNESPGITWSRAAKPWVKIDEKLLDRKHVVTLTTRKDAPDQQPMVYGVGAATGGLNDLKVLNGVIRQGAGKGSSDDCTYGMNPIFFYGNNNSEIAGVTVDYYGPQITGMQLYWSQNCHIHHNVVADRGTEILNRHRGTKGITSGGKKVHHNLMRRVRQCGLGGGGGAEVYSNEIYVDSYSTNSFGIIYLGAATGVCRNNKIFGGGYHMIGIGPFGVKGKDFKILSNFIHLQATEPNDRFREYGKMSLASCLRLTWGGVNIEHAENILIVKARDGGVARGIWTCPIPEMKDIVYRNNIVKVIAEDDASKGKAAIAVAGHSEAADAPMLFKDNTVISNLCHVMLGESYGVGCNARFYNNTFVKVGPDRGDYRTIQCGHWVLDSYGHVFRDSTFEGAAGYDKVKFAGGLEPLSAEDAKTFAKYKALRDFTVEWTLTLTAPAGARVTVKDKDGREVFTGSADQTGRLDIPLAQYKQEATGEMTHGESRKIEYTPHTVSVEIEGRTAARSVTMDRKREIEIKP
ncbi:MAG TPA: hypothetical protein VMZ92_13750 [Planctomycetota bacterium]|nr:hypothetical protein [Planctomycetota bacterium]